MSTMVIPLAPNTGVEIRLPIAGFDARDDHAFPGRRAAVVYLEGCPLQCGYCETASAMGPAREALEILVRRLRPHFARIGLRH